MKSGFPATLFVGLVLLSGCSDQPPAEQRAERPARGGQAPVANGNARGVVLFLGTSLTAGFGLSEEEAYPAVIQGYMDSLDLAFRAVNAGVSGETSAGALRRIDWLLRQRVDVLVLETGANDGLRGLPVPELRNNIQQIIDKTRQAYPDADIILAGMEAPPNFGDDYTDSFRQVYVDLARENDIDLVPFLLIGVAAVQALNQSDGIHPTASGQEIVASTVWQYLEPLLRERLAERS